MSLPRFFAQKNMKHSCTLFLILSFCFPVFGQLPTTFEPGRRDQQTDKITGTSPNVRWAIPIGSPNYATPVIAQGKVLVGSLNDAQLDPRRTGSRSVLICLDEKTGKLVWQLPLPKDYGISSMFDAFCVGISSTPTVVGDKVYLTTGRGEVLCLDINGLENGNSGPYTDEAFLYTPRGTDRGKVVNRNADVLPLAKTDADIIWRYDAFNELKAMPHDTNNCDIIYYDGLLIVNTGNAPDSSHRNVVTPEAPALIIMDAEKGIPLARDNFNIGSDISHGQWCSPTLGKVDGKDMIFYGGGNGVLHAVEAPSRAALMRQYEANGKQLVRLETKWKFQGDPRAHQPGGVVPPYVMGVGSASYTCLPPPLLDDEGRIFMLFGYDAWNAARPFRSWLACIDAKSGKLIWGTDNIEGGAVAPLAMADGLLYMADRRGNFYCFDPATGKEHWKLPLRGDIWARPLIAEGKIYVGTDRRMFYVLQAGLEPKIISEIAMPDRIFAPAAASGNTLYVVGDGFLYAVEGK
jgi:outer membrane protein assembly factor BamB